MYAAAGFGSFDPKWMRVRARIHGLRFQRRTGQPPPHIMMAVLMAVQRLGYNVGWRPVQEIVKLSLHFTTRSPAYTRPRCRAVGRSIDVP